MASETKPDVDQCAVVISDALATFFGTEEKEMLQSEALKRIWDYIKENQLEVWLPDIPITCFMMNEILLQCFIAQLIDNCCIRKFSDYFLSL